MTRRLPPCLAWLLLLLGSWIVFAGLLWLVSPIFQGALVLAAIIERALSG